MFLLMASESGALYCTDGSVLCAFERLEYLPEEFRLHSVSIVPEYDS